MKCKTIKIDDVEYVAKDSAQPVPGEAMRIVVADNRGLTFVGACSLDGDGEWITIRDARCIIVWGTNGHLAQIAERPTSNTKLGVARTVRVRRENIVLVYECGGGWK